MTQGCIQLAVLAAIGKGVGSDTPDSFSDGGQYSQLDAALRHAEAMVAAGATLIDVGGESTRPGARAVSPLEEMERVAPSSSVFIVNSM